MAHIFLLRQDLSSCTTTIIFYFCCCCYFALFSYSNIFLLNPLLVGNISFRRDAIDLSFPLKAMPFHLAIFFLLLIVDWGVHKQRNKFSLVFFSVSSLCNAYLTNICLLLSFKKRREKKILGALFTFQLVI